MRIVLLTVALRRFMRDPLRLTTVREFVVYCLFAVLLIPAAAAFAGIDGTGLAIAAAQNRPAYYGDYYGYYGGGPVYYGGGPYYYGGYGYGGVPYYRGHPLASW